jgi:hypothetical protein
MLGPCHPADHSEEARQEPRGLKVQILIEQPVDMQAGIEQAGAVAFSKF